MACEGDGELCGERHQPGLVGLDNFEPLAFHNLAAQLNFPHHGIGLLALRHRQLLLEADQPARLLDMLASYQLQTRAASRRDCTMPEQACRNGR